MTHVSSSGFARFQLWFRASHATAKPVSPIFISWSTWTNCQNSAVHQKIYFCQSYKNISVTLIDPHWTAIIVLAVAVVLFGSLREKRPVPRLNGRVLQVLNILVVHGLKIAFIKYKGWDRTLVKISCIFTRFTAEMNTETLEFSHKTSRKLLYDFTVFLWIWNQYFTFN